MTYAFEFPEAQTKLVYNCKERASADLDWVEFTVKVEFVPFREKSPHVRGEKLYQILVKSSFGKNSQRVIDRWQIPTGLSLLSSSGQDELQKEEIIGPIGELKKEWPIGEKVELRSQAYNIIDAADALKRQSIYKQTEVVINEKQTKKPNQFASDKERQFEVNIKSINLKSYETRKTFQIYSDQLRWFLKINLKSTTGYEFQCDLAKDAEQSEMAKKKI